MATRSDTHAPLSSQRLLRASALLLLVVGLLGHLYAAHAMGGSQIAYTHHVLGFFFILLVTGGLLALLGRRFWPTRWTTMLLAIGLVQAVLGLIVATEQLRAGTGP